MINTIVGAICACLASLSAAYAVMLVKGTASVEDVDKPAEKLETAKTRMISVPIIAESELKGYLVTRLEFVSVAAHGKSAQVPIESFVADEAFKVIYAQSSRDFDNLQKQDIAALTAVIAEGVNRRVGSQIVKHVLVDSWAFLNKKDSVITNEHQEH